MKLLMCKNCGDVFNLGFKTKTCACGKTSGKYLDNINAEYSGKYAIPLGFNNFELTTAIQLQPTKGNGFEFCAFVIPEKCDTFIRK